MFTRINEGGYGPRDLRFTRDFTTSAINRATVSNLSSVRCTAPNRCSSYVSSGTPAGSRSLFDEVQKLFTKSTEKFHVMASTVNTSIHVFLANIDIRFFAHVLRFKSYTTQLAKLGKSRFFSPASKECELSLAKIDFIAVKQKNIIFLNMCALKK